MSFLLFFRGLIAVLVVFSIVTYLVTHSLWSTLVQTAICGVLIQLGYFVAVLYMIWRTPAGEQGSSASKRKDATPKASMARKDVPVERQESVPHIGRSRQ